MTRIVDELYARQGGHTEPICERCGPQQRRRICFSRLTLVARAICPRPWNAARRVRSLRSALVCSLMLAGCAGGDAEGVSYARIDTLATGCVQVANTGRPRWTPETAWRLEEDLRIGTVAGDEGDPKQFGRIGSVSSDSRGRIYVLDEMAQEVRVFQGDGAFSRTIGRRGEGPGEFTFASTLTIGPGDTLTVLDDGAMRYSVFAPGGAFIQMHRRGIVGRGSPVQARLLDGRYVDWAMENPEGRMGARVLYLPVLYRAGFERADTFPPIDFASAMTANGRLLLDYNGSIVAAVDVAGRIWFADSREYRVYRRNLAGDTTLVFTLPVTPRPIDEAARDSVRQRWARRPDILAGQLDALPDTKPVLQAIVPDNAGQVYVFADVAGEPSGSFVDVFRETGEYLGRLALPKPVPLSRHSAPVAHATTEYLYVEVRDELDVGYVARWRIVRPER